MLTASLFHSVKGNFLISFYFRSMHGLLSLSFPPLSLQSKLVLSGLRYLSKTIPMKCKLKAGKEVKRGVSKAIRDRDPFVGPHNEPTAKLACFLDYINKTSRLYKKSSC